MWRAAEQIEIMILFIHIDWRAHCWWLVINITVVSTGDQWAHIITPFSESTTPIGSCEDVSIRSKRSSHSHRY